MRSQLKLKRLDSSPIPDAKNELRLILMVRNEELRLPYLMEYYFSKGVDRAFIIDNGSTDDSLSIASAWDRTHLFQTFETFRNYNNWTEVLLRKYGKNCWSLVVDSDEILHYPHADELTIKDLCAFMDEQGHTSLPCILLDMYAKGPIGLNEYKPGQDPLTTCPYFDPHFDVREVKWVNQRTQKKFSFTMFTGNLRQRVFEAEPNLSKFPLFRYGPGVYPAPGRHAIDGTVISNIRGVMFHFKYLHDFASRAAEEARREQHAGNAALYKQYSAKVQTDPDLNLYHSGSVQYTGDRQLLDLEIIKSSDALENFVKNKRTRRPAHVLS